MAEVGNLVVRLRGERSGLSSTLSQAKGELRGFASEARATGGVLKTALGTALGFAAAQVGMTALGEAVGFVKGAFIDFNSRLEQARIGFTTLLGSAAKADAFIAEMKTFAARTPFEFPGLQDAAQRMLAMGFSAEEVLPKLTAVGDAVAALGGSEEMVNRVTYALGQMQTAGRVNAQDMMQLTSAGIPAWQILADSIGKSVAETRKLAEQGLIPAKQAVEALTTGMEQRFGGMMAKQSQTFQGAMSTIRDSLNNALATAFKPFFTEISAGFVGLANMLSADAFQGFATRVGTALAGVVRAFGSLARQVIPALVEVGGQLWAALGPALGRLVPAVAAFVAGLMRIGVAFARDVAPALAGMLGRAASLGALIATQLGPVILGLVGALANLGRVIVTQVLPIVLELANRLWQGGLGKFVQALIGVVGQLIDQFAAFVSWVITNTPVVDALRVAVDALGAAFGFAADVMGAIPRAINTVFAAVYNTAVDVINTFVDAVNTIIDAYNNLPFDDISKMDRMVKRLAGSTREATAVTSGMTAAQALARAEANRAAQATSFMANRVKDDVVPATRDATAATTQATAAVEQFKFSVADAGRKAASGASGAKAALRDLASDAKTRLGGAFDAVREKATAFFRKLRDDTLRAARDARDLANAQLDAQIGAISAEVEAFRAAMDAKRQAREEAQLREQLAAAQAGDPETGAIDLATVAATQQALDDFLEERELRRLEADAEAKISALEAQKQANDTLLAEQERAANERYDAQVRAFDKELKALQTALARKPGEWRRANEQVLALLDRYGVTYEQSGARLGQAFADGLRRQAALVEGAARSLAAAAASQLKVASPAQRGPLAERQDRWGENLASSWIDGLRRGLAAQATFPVLGDIATAMGARLPVGQPAAPAPVAAAAEQRPMDITIQAGVLLATDGEARAFARKVRRYIEEDLYRTNTPVLTARRVGTG